MGKWEQIHHNDFDFTTKSFKNVLSILSEEKIYVILASNTYKTSLFENFRLSSDYEGNTGNFGDKHTLKYYGDVDSRSFDAIALEMELLCFDLTVKEAEITLEPPEDKTKLFKLTIQIHSGIHIPEGMDFLDLKKTVSWTTCSKCTVERRSSYCTQEENPICDFCEEVEIRDANMEVSDK
jgi:hypothetical protein